MRFACQERIFAALMKVVCQITAIRLIFGPWILAIGKYTLNNIENILNIYGSFRMRLGYIERTIMVHFRCR